MQYSSSDNEGKVMHIKKISEVLKYYLCNFFKIIKVEKGAFID